MLARLRKIEVVARPRRLDFSGMSPAERRWNVLFAFCAICIIGWLNGAATVDWGILGPKLVAGRPGPIALLAALVAFLGLATAGALISWRRSSAAFRRRASAQPAVEPLL
jgi:hypothetical protein